MRRKNNHKPNPEPMPLVARIEIIPLDAGGAGVTTYGAAGGTLCATYLEPRHASLLQCLVQSHRADRERDYSSYIAGYRSRRELAAMMDGSAPIEPATITAYASRIDRRLPGLLDRCRGLGVRIKPTIAIEEVKQ